MTFSMTGQEKGDL